MIQVGLSLKHDLSQLKPSCLIDDYSSLYFSLMIFLNLDDLFIFFEAFKWIEFNFFRFDPNLSWILFKLCIAELFAHTEFRAGICCQKFMLKIFIINGLPGDDTGEFGPDL